ncbi:CGNR zinc finger domain-containing protein [Nocardia altamirensis]|uniref:CGNR zinc finger domain-containing protein n=1 Tax=Nocardia altamirensis TaxID=472158 RepID=UPI000840679D|nr:CGNR zinc finger domain-containing protein [Nocardia altamirensis]
MKRYALLVADKYAFRFDCGSTWLNLLATKGRSFSADPVERLDSPARFTEWLERSELLPVRPPTAAELDQAIRLRETLRVLVLATIDGTEPSADSVTDLSVFLAEHDDPVHLIATDRVRREPPATASDALARIARQAVDHLTGTDRVTLKVCPEHDCRGVFTDTAGRRRWCPSPACASRGRVRAMRARRATDQTAGTERGESAPT